MPLVRIDVRKKWLAPQKKEIMDTIHSTMGESLKHTKSFLTAIPTKILKILHGTGLKASTGDRTRMVLVYLQKPR